MPIEFNKGLGLTDYDALAQAIALMKAAIEVTPNIWLSQAIVDATQELERWFDEEGNAIPVEPDDLIPATQVSPAEVLDAEGWFESHGLMLSKARSNGCFKIKVEQDLGLEYRDNAEAVAAKFGASPRIIRMLGYAMLANPWHLLPTHDISGLGGPGFQVPYIPVQPEVPFNEAEKQLFARNFFNSHFGKASLAGATFKRSILNMNPPDGPQVEGHGIWTYTNHPQDILTKVYNRFSTTGWLKRWYHMQVGLARQIDANRKARVPGYVTPEDQGGERTKAWYNSVEPGAVNKVPSLTLPS